MRAITAVSSCVAAGLLLCGCAPEGTTEPTDDGDLETCPVRTIAVEDLEDMGEPGCDLTGTALVFDDGVEMTIDGIGATQAQTEHVGQTQQVDIKRVVVNWGLSGVAATKIERGEPVRSWASTPEALELQEQHVAAQP
ncbi:MAG: hypothetical protein ACTHZX_09185 [Microbacterium sp.]